MTYKETLEAAVGANTFRLDPCLSIEGKATEGISLAFAELRRKLPASLYKSFKSSIIRSSFLIELTNPTAATDSTKYQVRWVEILKTENDVRYATYEQCLAICEKIVTRINGLDESNLQILEDYCNNSIFNFELPIDYIRRDANPFHVAENMDVFITPAIVRCTKVRRLIKDPKYNPKADIFKIIISKKIKVKAYQTDRAQTGNHQTNREKRWESHPENFQFAFRRDCNDVEASLILQVCMFEGVDHDLVSMLQKNGLLSDPYNKYKCPITGDVLNYSEFENEILHPDHGRSSFQVGHLEPLKATGGHEASNIGWISDDGNRIQGSLSMDEVKDLLMRIYRNRPELRLDYTMKAEDNDNCVEVFKVRGD
ncbi:MAG: hypothetical protein IJL03_10785 [Lachnospiraceae bacterium]|nr:hypothetical protein [Lachnospiraceae bacterium]